MWYRSHSFTIYSASAPIVELMTVYHARSHRNRRLRRFLVAGGLSALMVLGLMVAGVWAYGRSLDRNLDRVDAISATRAPATLDGPLNILLLGTDSRDPERTEGALADTIMVVHVDGDHQHAYLSSIARDTWVYVPRSADGKNGDTEAKINSAYAWGGAPLMVQTVESYTGLLIDHVVMIDFSGFQEVVDAIGGVTMPIEQTITSIHPPYRTFTAGTMHLTGAEALDYVRQRKQFARGDFDRQHHQQQLIVAVLDQLTAAGTLANPVRLNAALQTLTAAVTVDRGFDLVQTALALKSIGGADLTFLSSPNAGLGTEDGQSVVEPDQAAAKRLYDAFGSDTVAEYLAAQSASPTPSVPTPVPTR
jgi:LCP family protein required for cell wall assembly